MVSFICNACGNTVKKNQVEKHYQQQCRNCSVLSCIDCGVDFPGDSYAAHTSCITEAEKYQGHLYQAKDKDNKGDAKQKEWIKQLKSAGTGVTDPRLKHLLVKIMEYSNIPRKKKKFENFCKNSVNVYDEKTLNALWDAFNSANQDKKDIQVNGNRENEPAAKKSNIIEDSENETNDQEITDKNINMNNTKKNKKAKKRSREKEVKEDDDNTMKKRKRKKKLDKIEEIESEEADVVETEKDTLEIQGKFNWHKAIKMSLKQADDYELPVKKLRKKVLSAYQEHGIDNRANTIEECRAMFDKKLKTYPKVKVKKEVVKLIK